MISVVMTTYDPGDERRTSVAQYALRSLIENLQYPSLRWVISDDGSSGRHVEKLWGELFGRGEEVVMLDAARRGVGYSKNIALRNAFSVSPLVLLTEDDWLLKEPFDLAPYAEVLLNHDDVGMVRLGYLGGEMTASHVDYSGMPFWKLHQGSGVYIYSGQVALIKKSFYDSVGYHQEGVSPGEEELERCLRYNATENAPAILWPARIPSALNSGLFINIGLDYSLNNISPESVG